ncbi:hypothetical protein [Nocardia stercoris]|uniref:hypothetical protein n=1 Tax=Nocardia stercoris TaxID=2483361 RepID=UPI0011C43AF1|nr:hypothetical protein [Nocardia stercoris]
MEQTAAGADAARSVDQASTAWMHVQQIETSLSALGAGTDPPYSSGSDQFESMTHQQLYDAVHGPAGLDPAGLLTMAQTWSDSAGKLDTITGLTLPMGLNAIFGHGLWEGGAANAAKAASDAFTAAGNQIGQVFMDLADRMNGLHYSAEAVRAAVPAPAAPVVLTPHPDNLAASLLPGLANPQVTDQAAAAQEQARQDAIRALRAIYSPAFPPSGTGVPSYIDVPSVAQPGGPSSVGPGTPAPGAPDTAAPSPDTPSADNPGDSPASQPSGTQTQPLSTGTPTGTDPAEPSPASTTPAGIAPAGLAPGAQPDLGAPIGLGPNLGSPTDTGPGGPGSPRLPSPGLSVPGAVEDAAAAQARLGTSRPGSAPGQLGQLPHGAGKGEKDEDKEHFSPDYLKRVQSDWTDGLEGWNGVVGANPDFGGRHDWAQPVSIESASPASQRRPSLLDLPPIEAGPPENTDTAVDTSPSIEPAPPPPSKPLSPTAIAAKLAESGISLRMTSVSAEKPASGPHADGQGKDLESEDPGTSSAAGEKAVTQVTLTGTGPVMDDDIDEGAGGR